MAKKTATDYEQWWEDYAEINRLDPGTRVRKEIIWKELKSSKYQMILDLGCGTGELLEVLHAAYPKKELYGSDYSKKAIEILNKRKLTKKTFIDNLETAKSLTGTYDAVVCSEVIEHLKNWENALILMCKACKKGGKLIVTTQAGKRFPHHLEIGHIQHFTLDMITDVLEKHGCKITRSERIGFPFMNLKNYLVSHVLKGEALKTGKISFTQKLGLQVFYYLYHISIGNGGPQIVITATKK